LKILVTLSRFPWPTDKGDKLRAWHQLQGLAMQHQVYAFCLSDDLISEEDKQRMLVFCREVKVFSLKKASILGRVIGNLSGNLPFQVAYFNDPEARKAFNAFHQLVKPDVIYCQLARMAEFSRNISNCYKIIDYQDAFSKGIERRITDAPFYQKPLLREEFRRLVRYESEIFNHFDCRTIISAQDAQLISHDQNQRFVVVPNGVDTEYYKPEPVSRSIDLLFTGNMQYEPNVNCVVYLIEKVFPWLQKEMPHLQLVAAGKNPAAALRRLRTKHLYLTGWVDDLRTYYRQARLFVAPMQIGIGMQNKILEAMSMGMPVITSSLANNAIGAEHGKNIWVADHPQKVAEAIVYLLSNTEHAMQLGRNARIFMQAHFSWQKQNELLCSLVESGVGTAIQK
jgi:polysaccharide biosynthesis protein PslH